MLVYNDKFDFGQALIYLKDGQKITREGWNGKNQWVVMMPALYLEAEMVNERTKKFIGDNTPLDSQPYFALKNAQGKWQPGWVPSTGDLLAEDWQIIINEK